MFFNLHFGQDFDSIRDSHLVISPAAQALEALVILGPFTLADGTANVRQILYLLMRKGSLEVVFRVEPSGLKRDRRKRKDADPGTNAKDCQKSKYTLLQCSAPSMSDGQSICKYRMLSGREVIRTLPEDWRIGT
ncbi:MAG: hypothetical protein WD624_07025 [Rhodospirillales bacterium]